MMEKRQCFYVREEDGLWMASVSHAYPVLEPVHKAHESYQDAYDWASAQMQGKIDPGFLPGMFYVYA